MTVRRTMTPQKRLEDSLDSIEETASFRGVLYTKEVARLIAALREAVGALHGTDRDEVLLKVADILEGKK